MTPQEMIGAAFVRSSCARVILPVLCALGLIALIEGILTISINPTFWEKTTWLLHDLYSEEQLDRLIIYEKLRVLSDSKPDIISIGDSSGFFSIQPTIVNRYTHGLKYINLSTGGNHTFEGFKGIAEFMLQRTKTIKYVVLYILPFRASEESLVTFGAQGRTLRGALSGLMSYISPPSAGLSAQAKAKLFEGRTFGTYAPSNHKLYFELKDNLERDLGWAPEHDVRFDRVGMQLPFLTDQRLWYRRFIGEQSFIYSQLDDIARIVRKHGAKLVVAFQAMPARAIKRDDQYRSVAEQAIARFQEDNVDVAFPFPLITPFGPEKWAMWNHISREYTFISSKRMGIALGHIIANPTNQPKFKAQLQD